MRVKVFSVRLTNENLENDQKQLNDFFDQVNIISSSAEVIPGQPNKWTVMVFYSPEKNIQFANEKSAVSSYEELTDEEAKNFEVLRHWRRAKAAKLNVPAYFILHDTVLKSIVKRKPKTLNEFMEIRGFGPRSLNKYGNKLLALVNSFSEKGKG